MTATPMKNLYRLLLVSGLITAEILCAQTAPTEQPAGGPRHRGPGGPGGPGRMSPVIRTLDADHDGEISAAEIAGAPAALLTLDTNKDGSLSAEELRPARPADAPTPPADAPRRGPGGPGGHARPANPVMLALDANNDGALSAAEIANAAASLKALDANKDGKLTRDELRPLPPAN